MSKMYEVCIPIAGHVVKVVEAESAEDAIEKAMDDAHVDDIESWEVLTQFNQGHVCYCPRPWKVTAEVIVDE